jgi:hypothetical protein
LSYASGRLYVVSDGGRQAGNDGDLHRKCGGKRSASRVAASSSAASAEAEPGAPARADVSGMGGLSRIWGDRLLPLRHPAKIERYDLATGSWLVPISLPEGPAGFTVAGSAIYVSFGNAISKFPLDGSTETPLCSTAHSIRNSTGIRRATLSREREGLEFFCHRSIHGELLAATNLSTRWAASPPRPQGTRSSGALRASRRGHR